MAWQSCSSICRDSTTKRVYRLKARCGRQNEPKSRVSGLGQKNFKKSKNKFLLKSSETYSEPLFEKKFEKKIKLGGPAGTKFRFTVFAKYRNFGPSLQPNQ